MKSILVAAFLAVCLIASGQYTQPSSPAPTAVPQVKLSTTDFINTKFYPATALLYQQTSDGSMRFSCTVTAILHSKDSYLFATAAHCLEKNSTPFLTADETNGEKTFIRVDNAACGRPNQGMDVCVIQIHSKKHFEVVPLGEDPKGYGGMPIISIASPVGMGKQVFHGYISQTQLERPMGPKGGNWYGAMVLQLPGTQGGSSGSAIVCEDQQAICGITVGVVATPAGQVTIAMPVSRLAALILRMQ